MASNHQNMDINDLIHAEDVNSSDAEQAQSGQQDIGPVAPAIGSNSLNPAEVPPPMRDVVRGNLRSTSTNSSGVQTRFQTGLVRPSITLLVACDVRWYPDFREAPPPRQAVPVTITRQSTMATTQVAIARGLTRSGLVPCRLVLQRLRVCWIGPDSSMSQYTQLRNDADIFRDVFDILCARNHGRDQLFAMFNAWPRMPANLPGAGDHGAQQQAVSPPEGPHVNLNFDGVNGQQTPVRGRGAGTNANPTSRQQAPQTGAARLSQRQGPGLAGTNPGVSRAQTGNAAQLAAINQGGRGMGRGQHAGAAVMPAPVDPAPRIPVVLDLTNMEQDGDGDRDEDDEEEEEEEEEEEVDGPSRLVNCTNGHRH